jgi:phosphoenolpyruvate-protein kinase (PTS system EI component)
MASDPLATPALVGLGVRELSVVTPAIATIKATLAGLDSLACQSLARELLILGDAETVRARLHAFTAS